jgi:hypothetical protein
MTIPLPTVLLAAQAACAYTCPPKAVVPPPGAHAGAIDRKVSNIWDRFSDEDWTGSRAMSWSKGRGAIASGADAMVAGTFNGSKEDRAAARYGRYIRLLPHESSRQTTRCWSLSSCEGYSGWMLALTRYEGVDDVGTCYDARFKWKRLSMLCAAYISSTAFRNDSHGGNTSAIPSWKCVLAHSK